MNTQIKIMKKQAQPIVDLVFPDYTGRKFKLEFTDQVLFYDTNWGGGTRNYYAAVKSNGAHQGLSIPAPWVNPVEGLTMQLPPDVLIVAHSIFFGHDMGITIYAHPSNAPKWLKEANND
jgi:hypothetical protein